MRGADRESERRRRQRPVPASPQTGRVNLLVEVLASAAEARGTYTLTLWDADQKRTVTLGNVTFP